MQIFHSFLYVYQRVQELSSLKPKKIRLFPEENHKKSASRPWEYIICIEYNIIYVYIYMTLSNNYPHFFVEIHHIPCLNQVKLLFGVVIACYTSFSDSHSYISHISIIRFPYRSIPMTDLNSQRNDQLFVRLGTNVQPQRQSFKAQKKRHVRIP